MGYKDKTVTVIGTGGDIGTNRDQIQTDNEIFTILTTCK